MKTKPTGTGAFYALWATQTFSALGSAMTSFALVIWSFQQEGSALRTALLTICSYAPYVLMSIFAGALSDRWDKRRTMLICDVLAALCTLAVLLLYHTGLLRIWHLYAINALSGLMNTVQQPASDVAISLLTPKDKLQRFTAMQSLSNSLTTVLSPVLATALLTLFSLDAVILFDFITCGVAVLSLGLFIRIPHVTRDEAREPVLQAARKGLSYLRDHRGILDLMLMLSGINFVASMHNAAIPAMILTRPYGGETVLGLLNTITGLATLAGSVLVSALPAPKSRVRVILNTLLLSMGTENLLLALGRSQWAWYVGAILGWGCIPIMSTNLGALLRSQIPIEMQGRVFSARNTLQFFTIPLGYLAGGWLVDQVTEPLMASLPQGHALLRLLGAGKGSGAALLFLCLWMLGIFVCLAFRKDKHIRALEA